MWITSEPSKRIPDYLLLNLHKLAWNHVTMDVLQQEGVPESTAESTVDGGEAPLAVNYRSPQTYLHAGIEAFFSFLVIFQSGSHNGFLRNLKGINP